MQEPQGIPWPRIAAEGAAIVVSILLAFAIDAWWGERQSRFQEQTILATLIEEFQDKQRTIEAGRRFNAAMQSSIQQLLDIGLGDDTDFSEQRVDALLADLWWYNDRTDWTTGALNSLILSGNLSLISDGTLRARLIEWWARFDVIGGFADADKSFYFDRQLPYWSEHAYLPQILDQMEHVPGNPDDRYEYGRKLSPKSRLDHSDLLRDRQFQNLLVERSVGLADLVTIGFNNLEHDLAEMLGSLRDEQAR